MSGPSVSPRPSEAVHSAIALARRRWSGQTWVISASVDGSSAAAPTPARAWPTQTSTTSDADRQISDPAANRPSPARYTFLRPYRSPRRPQVSSSAAVGRMKASVTHWSWTVDASSACWITGSEVETPTTGR